MVEMATPNLPSRDFDATEAFYAGLGFERSWRDGGWLILRRGPMQLEFFLWPEFDANSSAFGACLRLDDIAPLVAQAAAAGIPERAEGRPRFQRPRREAWGGLVGFVIDPDGSLIRMVQAPA